MKIQKDNLSWLTTVPASDINFKCRLKDSNSATIKKALACKSLSKSAVQKLTSELKRKLKSNL